MMFQKNRQGQVRIRLRLQLLLALGSLQSLATFSEAGEPKAPTIYKNQLAPIKNPAPLLAGHPKFVEPIRERSRWEASMLIDEKGADLSVRGWRFSYNARGIIEIPNRLRSDRTAVIVVHPWGIDDGQGWTTPAPAGAAFFCTPEKNRIYHAHVREVVNPFLKHFREHVAMVMYSLPGKEDAIRKKLYRSYRSRPDKKQRAAGASELKTVLKNFSYTGESLPKQIQLSSLNRVNEYFAKVPSLDAGARYNNVGFWNLPIPVVKEIAVDPHDVVIYDGDGYDALRDYLKKNGIRHILLAGYATDMCVCHTTAGYKNLKQDFNVFLVGDLTLATFPASATPVFATQAAIAKASMDVLISQVSWIKPLKKDRVNRGGGNAQFESKTD